MCKLRYITIIVIFFTVTIQSCKIGHKYKQPELQGMPRHFEDGVNDTVNTVADVGWSTLYPDSVLQALINRALENNKDMKIAAAKIKEMIAQKRISSANLLPEVGIEVLHQKENLNYKNPSYKSRGQFTMSWELDIWGNLRWQKEADVAAYMQSVQAQRALHLTIVAQVAQTYFELKALDRELTIVRQTLESRKESAHFAKLRFEGGLTSEIPYRQSLVELARTETLVPNLENQIKLKEYDLAILVGEFPSTLIPRGEDLKSQKIPEQLPADLPSSLLKRRPDVLQAEQKLIQANAKVGVAFTDIFPSLKLTGKYGVENSELSQIFKNPAWWLSGSLVGPLFNFGKNKSTYNAAQAVYEQEIFSYEKTIMNVFKEVNGALISFEKAKEIRKSREELYNSAQSYYKLARLQYVNGIVNYIDVLDSQRQLFDAEITLNSAILNELISAVTLYKSLGGGLVQ